MLILQLYLTLKATMGGGSGTGTAATIAGTVMITNVDHGSKVLLGNNVQINSEGTVDVGLRI